MSPGIEKPSLILQVIRSVETLRHGQTIHMPFAGVIGAISVGTQEFRQQSCPFGTLIPSAVFLTREHGACRELYAVGPESFGTGIQTAPVPESAQCLQSLRTTRVLVIVEKCDYRISDPERAEQRTRS